jgi:hypothetical protein
MEKYEDDIGSGGFMIGGYDNNEKRNEEKLMKEKKDR